MNGQSKNVRSTVGVRFCP